MVTLVRLIVPPPRIRSRPTALPAASSIKHNHETHLPTPVSRRTGAVNSPTPAAIQPYTPRQQGRTKVPCTFMRKRPSAHNTSPLPSPLSAPWHLGAQLLPPGQRHTYAHALTVNMPPGPGTRNARQDKKRVIFILRTFIISRYTDHYTMVSLLMSMKCNPG